MIPMRCNTLTRRGFLNAASLAVLQLAGCGTLLYPERRGQKGGRLDWKVIALDGAGLLLFFVPGVIAFAVDIMEGTIYLPPEEYGSTSPALHDSSRFQTLTVPRDQMNRAGIARVVSAKTGKNILLEDESYQTARLSSLDEFAKVRSQLQAEHS